MKTLHVGIVGLGRLGRRHAQTLSRHPNVKLSAAASVIAEERTYAQQTLGVEHVCDRLDALLAVTPLDAVVLVTPTALHASQSEAVLKAGKHLFVEKPLALNIADCEAVERTYAETRQQYPQQFAMVGFNRRFDADYQAAKAAIDNGEIGTPYFFRAQTCDKLDPNGFFIKFAATSGGIIMDCNIHDIDLVRWLMSDKEGNVSAVARVYATGCCAVHPELAQYQDVDNAISTIEFADGRMAHLYSSRTFAHGHETSTEIIGTQGKLLIGADAASNRVVKSDANGVGHQALPDFFARFEASFEHEIQAFVATCLGEQTLRSNLHDATEATRIGVALTESLRSHTLQSLH